MDIKSIQENLLWTERFTAAFQSDPREHRDFAHALSHVHLFSGRLADQVNMWDHYESPGLGQSKIGPMLAEIVIACVRMAKTYPGGEIDLDEQIRALIERREANIKRDG